MEFKDKKVAEKYELSDAEQRDTHIHVPKHYAGLLSGITIEAADEYVEKQKGRIIRLKTPAAGNLKLTAKSDLN